MLNALYIRGRHFGVNVISSTHTFNALSTIIRVNRRQLYFFKMRNYTEIQTMVKELSALLIKTNFLKINILTVLDIHCWKSLIRQQKKDLVFCL